MAKTIKSKKEIMDVVHRSNLNEMVDGSHEEALLETLLDIRDTLIEISEKLKDSRVKYK